MSYNQRKNEDAKNSPRRFEQKDDTPELYSIFCGEVASIQPYGAFVRIPGYRKNGLVHKTQISVARVEDVSDVLAVGDRVFCKVISLGEEGNMKISLSMKLVNQGQGKDLDANLVQMKQEEHRRKKGQTFVQPKIELGAVFNTVCRKCGTKGHLARDCFQVPGSKTYDLLPDDEVMPLPDNDEINPSSAPQKKKKKKKEKKKRKSRKHWHRTVSSTSSDSESDSLSDRRPHKHSHKHHHTSKDKGKEKKHDHRRSPSPSSSDSDSSTRKHPHKHPHKVQKHHRHRSPRPDSSDSEASDRHPHKHHHTSTDKSGRPKDGTSLSRKRHKTYSSSSDEHPHKHDYRHRQKSKDSIETSHGCHGDQRRMEHRSHRTSQHSESRHEAHHEGSHGHSHSHRSSNPKHR